MNCMNDMFNYEVPLTNEEMHSDNEDADICSKIDLQALFREPYRLERETAVSMKKNYVLHLSSSLVSKGSVAVGLSDHSCAIYDIEQLTHLNTIKGHRSSLINVKFSTQNENLLYSGAVEGSVKLWDLRTPSQCSKEFKDATDGSDKLKPLTSFDVTFNDRIVCAGTEVVDGDAFLLFWDTRSSKLLGGYWESHVSDITQTCFHPSKQDTCATASTDGLINIFDINKGCEDDALLYSLNTESSVEKIGWISVHGDISALSCITHTQILQLWDMDGAAPFAQFQREEIAKALQRKSCADCYLVDVHQKSPTEELILLAGSTSGRGECLRTLEIEKNNLIPMANFEGNKQIVRASWYDQYDGLLLTGGESGILDMWKPDSTVNASISNTSELKVNSKVKHKLKQKPY